MNDTYVSTHTSHRCLPSQLTPYLQIMREAACETLWPTRCALCDVPGTLLCERCRKHLPFIDRYHACPRCGYPHGRYICTECNHFILEKRGLEAYPLDGCASVFEHQGSARRLITTYKDRGEQRLAPLIAHLIADAIDPAWHPDIMTTIPTRRKARRQRGFDHLEQVGVELARLIDKDYEVLLLPHERSDQRVLGAQERLHNMKNSFTVKADASIPPRVLIVDDVLTTGATLFNAANALRLAGAQCIYGVTLARA